jgi:hypothetical protein
MKKRINCSRTAFQRVMLGLGQEYVPLGYTDACGDNITPKCPNGCECRQASRQVWQPGMRPGSTGQWVTISMGKRCLPRRIRQR